MLDLKIAELYADVSIRMATFNRQLGQVQARLASFTPPPINVTVNTAAATARLNLLLQQIRAVQAAASARVNAGGGGGAGGGAGAAAGGGYWTPQLRAQQQVGAIQFAAQQRAARQAAAAARAAAAAHAAQTRAFMGGINAAGTGLGQGLGAGFIATPMQAAGMGIGVGLKESVTTAIDLESKFAEVRRVAGLSADQTARLKSDLMAISVMQPGATLDDLIKMADIGGRMGLAGKDLTVFASGLAMVKNSVSGMETEDLANNMSRVLHVFQLGPEYIKGFGSALTAMDNATTASASDILKITQGLSGTAASIGVTLPQVIALSAAMRDVGMTNAVASSSMSQVFRKMATNSHEFAAAAGMDAKEFEEAYRKGPMVALSALMKALMANKDTIAAQEVLKSLGLQGVRTGGMLLQLGQAFDRVAGLTKTAGDEFTSLKSLLDADALKGETTAAGLGKLQNAATGLADSLGSLALPRIKELTSALLEMNQALGQGQGQMVRSGSGLAAKFGDNLVNNNPLAMIPGLAGRKLGLGRFNGFARAREAILGKDVVAAPGAPGGAPALPVKPPSVASSTGDADSATAKRAGEDFFAGLKNRLGVAKAVGGVFAGALGQDAAKLGGMLRAPTQRSASVGISAVNFGQQLQADILNGKKEEEVARNTGDMAKTLAEMLSLAKQGGKQVANALLGPE